MARMDQRTVPLQAHYPLHLLPIQTPASLFAADSPILVAPYHNFRRRC